MERPGLLVVDDDDSIRLQLKWAFSPYYSVIEAAGRKEAIEAFRTERPPVAIIDLGLPPRPFESSEGLRTILEVLEASPSTKTIAVSGLLEREHGLKAIDLGAYDFLHKPFDLDELKIIVKRAFSIHNMQREIALKTPEASGNSHEMLGMSKVMIEAFSMIKKVAPSDVPVLILGESGTGKKLAARSIHSLSKRKNGPFAAINCATMPEDQLEAELFGYEKGAFTGAENRKKGKIENANGGTLFLGEIGELSLKLQVKLLRFLQDRKIERLGSREAIELDVRIISGANRGLREMTGKEEFRGDLFFRLSVVTLVMPPLRERGDDIFTIAHALLKKYSGDFKSAKGFSQSALAAMRAYSWPGNVRELEKKIKRAAAMGRSLEITPDDLELEQAHEEPVHSNCFHEAKEDFKRKMVLEKLIKNNWAISRSAFELGISRQYLSRLMTRYGLRVLKGDNCRPKE